MDIDPKLREWATARQHEYLDAVALHGGYKPAARALGVAEGSLRNSLKGLKSRAAKMGYSPEHDMNKIVPDGFMVKGVSTYYDEDGKPRGQWVKSSVDADRQREVMEAAFAAMSENLPRQERIAPPKATLESLCNLAVFTDYHIGQLSWGVESGADWDLSIAEKLVWDAFGYMIDAAPRAKTMLLVLQGDWLHSDGLLPLTPAHKNVLDTDGRFSKIVAAAIRVMRRMINHALAKHENVHLIICEGNHDEASSVWLRQMFAALYEHEPRISVNDSELPYYAYQHGETMLAFHHGHKLKPEQLPALFAAQFSKMWGNTTKRYAHCGHRHHVDEKEYSGMTVTQHPTLAARDAHASRGGWISDRAAQVITYHSKYGQHSRVMVCPEMFAEPSE